MTILPIFFRLSPANVHDVPFARHLLKWAVRLYSIRPRIVRLAAAASIIVGLPAQQAGRPELIRSPKRVLAHSWEAL
jgi:hypothetical protein